MTGSKYPEEDCVSLFKDISTDVIKLLCWIGFFIALFFIALQLFIIGISI